MFLAGFENAAAGPAQSMCGSGCACIIVRVQSAWQAILLGGAKLKRGDVSGVDAPVSASLPVKNGVG